MAEIIWLDPAVFDLEEIVGYIALDNPDAADRLVYRILKHLDQLIDHPLSGPVPPELPNSEYRQIVEPPCRIFYKIQKDIVYIVNVRRSEQLFRPGRFVDEVE